MDIDELALVPADLSKQSMIVKSKVIKKTEYNAKIKNIKYKTPDIINLT